MKSTFLFIPLLFLCFFISFSSYGQNEENQNRLDSLENMSWEELISIGIEFRDNYELDKAEIYLKKVVEVAEKQNGKDSLYAVSCRELGIAYYYQGLYDKTEHFWLEAKEIREKKLGKDHLDYATSCNDLANLYSEQGLYQKAELLYLKTKEIREKKLGKDHLDYATSCNSLAILYGDQGLYQKAEPLYIEAKKIREKKLGKEHPNYAMSCNNLGFLYRNQGLSQKAETLLLEAKEIQEKIVGKEHLDYAKSCSNLAIIYADQGLHQKAETLFIEAKEINEKVLGKEHPDYALSCNNLAALYFYQKLYQKAETLFIEAKEISEKILGKEHPSYALTCDNLAVLYGNQGLNQKAEMLFKEALQNKKQQIKILFPTLSENEKQAYFSSIGFFFTDFLDFATQYYSENKKISQDIYNQQLFTKGIIFSSTQKMKEQIMSSKDTVLIRKYEDWKTQKENYITLFQTPISQRDSTFDMAKMASQINELEREISKKSELFKSNTDQKEYTWQDVKQSLSEKEAAIEIIRLIKKDVVYQPQDTVYIALILTKETKENPELLLLENGQELENGALNFYQNNIDFQLEDTESYNQYWKPIQDKLDALSKKGYSKIYFSPDGIYHKVNLNTLQNPKTKEFLVEEQNIQLITSSRDLIERNEKGEQKIDLSKNFADYKTFLLGYPAYNLFLNSEGKDTLKVNGEDRSLNGLQRVVGQQTVVPVLEGTKVETNQINDLFAQKNVKTTLLQNKEATEENIKELENPTILHIATHGFFINQIPESEVTTMQEAEDRTLLQNPFLRSGLLLAGCQNPQLGQEDGILSAEEAMNLNLDGTELVVLSACETGLGDIQNGEGVYGLQRAFRQAGAKTLIMSLWKVSDEATQLLMVTFYEEFLSGKSKREAFKIAQLKLKQKYSEPYYWGAFVMVGE